MLYSWTGQGEAGKDRWESGHLSPKAFSGYHVMWAQLRFNLRGPSLAPKASASVSALVLAGDYTVPLFEEGSGFRC